MRLSWQRDCLGPGSVSRSRKLRAGTLEHSGDRGSHSQLRGVFEVSFVLNTHRHGSRKPD